MFIQHKKNPKEINDNNVKIIETMIENNQELLQSENFDNLKHDCRLFPMIDNYLRDDELIREYTKLYPQSMKIISDFRYQDYIMNERNKRFTQEYILRYIIKSR